MLVPMCLKKKVQIFGFSPNTGVKCQTKCATDQEGEIIFF